jgi:hypothetical protein
MRRGLIAMVGAAIFLLTAAGAVSAQVQTQVNIHFRDDPPGSYLLRFGGAAWLLDAEEGGGATGTATTGLVRVTLQRVDADCALLADFTVPSGEHSVIEVYSNRVEVSHPDTIDSGPGISRFRGPLPCRLPPETSTSAATRESSSGSGLPLSIAAALGLAIAFRRVGRRSARAPRA